MTTDAKNSFGVFQADPTPANAVQLAIDDHCYGAVQDWPFVDQLRKAKERAEAYPALVAALKGMVIDGGDGKFEAGLELLRSLGEA